MEQMKTETITLGAGCFWCVEAIFQQINGVLNVKPGYSGGLTQNPSYQEVCTGQTKHVEVCQITFNPDIISLEELLVVYWKTHDPTTEDRQGEDIGNQYRSVVFYRSSEQKATAERVKNKIIESNIFEEPIVTKIEEFTEFFPAEDYHKDYYNLHTEQNYCSFVIRPKLEKFDKVFSHLKR